MVMSRVHLPGQIQLPLSPPLALEDVGDLLLLTFCLLLLPLWESVIVLLLCFPLLYVHSSIAIILMGKRELVACLICLPGVL